MASTLSRDTFLATTLALLLIFLVDPSDELAMRHWKPKRDEEHSLKLLEGGGMEPCVCGVFMSGQLNRTAGRRVTPTGEPVLAYESDDVCLPCGAQGYKQCINKCLDVIVKHLPKAGPLICSALDRECHREKAFLFIRNCNEKWTKTNFSAGKEFCCEDGEQVKCSREH